MLNRFINEQRAAFIPFVVAGHPNVETSQKVIDILVEEGADLIELGVPFSDAMADGPVIQQASAETVALMPSMAEVLSFAAKIHFKHPGLPLILFSYFNPLLQHGLERFALEAAQAGIAAVLVVDLPPEEATTYLETMNSQKLKTIFLASPTSSDSRVKRIAEASSGFVYAISRLGVTGVQSQLSSELKPDIERLRRLGVGQLAIGFGISTPDQAQEVARWADAVVVGSAFVKLAADALREPSESFKKIRSLAREISKALQVRRASNQ